MYLIYITIHITDYCLVRENGLLRLNSSGHVQVCNSGQWVTANENDQQQLVGAICNENTHSDSLMTALGAIIVLLVIALIATVLGWTVREILLKRKQSR